MRRLGAIGCGVLVVVGAMAGGRAAAGDDAASATAADATTTTRPAATATTQAIAINIVGDDDIAFESDPRGVLFRISRDASDVEKGLLIRLNVGGTATPGVHFARPPTWVVMPRGVAAIDVRVFPFDDSVADANRTITVGADVAGVGTYLTPATRPAAEAR